MLYVQTQYTGQQLGERFNTLPKARAAAIDHVAHGACGSNIEDENGLIEVWETDQDGRIVKG